jgi:hypothetical protein
MKKCIRIFNQNQPLLPSFSLHGYSKDHQAGKNLSQIDLRLRSNRTLLPSHKKLHQTELAVLLVANLSDKIIYKYLNYST